MDYVYLEGWHIWQQGIATNILGQLWKSQQIGSSHLLQKPTENVMAKKTRKEL
jgi:hypothetical protein